MKNTAINKSTHPSELKSVSDVYLYISDKYSDNGIDFDYTKLDEYQQLCIEVIIKSISGKNVKARRVNALQKAGFETGDIETKWNFGQVGTIKKTEGGYFAQVAYATGGKSRNGYGVNACPVVFVKKA